MSMKQVLEAWQQDFNGLADRQSDVLLEEAKAQAKTYREASAYIKRVNQLCFGDITEPVTRASRGIAGAVCDLALYKLHEEERDMPIKQEV